MQFSIVFLPRHSHPAAVVLLSRLDKFVAVLIPASLAVLLLEVLDVLLAVVALGVWLDHLGDVVSLAVEHPECIALLAHQSVRDALLHVVRLVLSGLHLVLALRKHFLVHLVLILVILIKFLPEACHEARLLVLSRLGRSITSLGNCLSSWGR